MNSKSKKPEKILIEICFRSPLKFVFGFTNVCKQAPCPLCPLHLLSLGQALLEVEYTELI